MTRSASLPEAEPTRFDAASAWQLRLAQDPSLELSEEFQAWLADPENERAFSGVSAAWHAAEAFAVEPQLLDMRQAALRHARQASTRRWSPHRALARAAAAVVALAVMGGGAIYYFATAPSVYATGVGDRRTVVLSDGSQIALDSDSEVKVRYLEDARTLLLDRGRARFEVAHDIARPFTVTAGEETVVAVGTSFDVERIGAKVMVTLIDGKVVVKNDQSREAASEKPAPVQSVSLAAGQQLVANANANAADRQTIRPADLKSASAWQSGQLIFSGDTLEDAVARVNRYTAQPIKVDRKIGSIRIIGAFNAGDVASFVGAVTSYFPVQATTLGNAILLQPRA